jgi:hypothetical protein
MQAAKRPDAGIPKLSFGRHPILNKKEYIPTTLIYKYENQEKKYELPSYQIYNGTIIHFEMVPNIERLLTPPLFDKNAVPIVLGIGQTSYTVEITTTIIFNTIRYKFTFDIPIVAEAKKARPTEPGADAEIKETVDLDEPFRNEIIKPFRVAYNIRCLLYTMLQEKGFVDGLNLGVWGIEDWCDKKDVEAIVVQEGLTYDAFLRMVEENDKYVVSYRGLNASDYMYKRPFAEVLRISVVNRGNVPTFDERVNQYKIDKAMDPSYYRLMPPPPRGPTGGIKINRMVKTMEERRRIWKKYIDQTCGDTIYLKFPSGTTVEDQDVFRETDDGYTITLARFIHLVGTITIRE